MPKTVQPIPIKFIYEEGSFGAWSKLELVNGTFYETPQFEKVALRRREPTLEKWITFRYLLDHLNAWNWRPDYCNQNILDGTQWSLEIEYGDTKISCSGSNSYPALLDADYQEDGGRSLDWELFEASLFWLSRGGSR
jgi:hypothetical protein